MRVRAAVLEEFGSPLRVQELELEEPRAGEVLVRLEACGVCHTDMYTASGADPSGYVPAVLGHEGGGVVDRVGEGVTLVEPGDHVVTLFSPQCGECVHCLSPKTNICLAIREEQNRGHLPDGSTRLSRDGEQIRHFMGTSTFAEATVMPEIALAKVDPEAPLDRACLFACGLSTGLGAAINTANVEPGSTCVVFGAGMVGLGAVAGCRLRGAERIVAVDLSEDRLQRARDQGATDTLVGGPDAVDSDALTHENPITLRIPSCASISSKPRFTSSSVSRWDTNASTSIAPSRYSRMNSGTWSRPLTPPNDEPATRRPVIRRRGTMSSVSPLPATPATVHSPQPIRAASTAWRMMLTSPVASKV